MDNLENGAMDPAGAIDVDATSGQSNEIETQSTDATEESAPIDVQESESVAEMHPWDADDRFKGKTPDQMYEIVREADKYKGQLSQKAKVADMLSQQFGLTPERMEEIAQQRAYDAQQQQIQADPISAVYNELQEVKTQLVIKEEDSKLNSFLAEQPQYADFREEIKNLGFTVDRDKTWAEIADKYFGRAIVKGQEAAYKQLNVKQNTQATSVSRGDINRSVTLDEMQNMSAAELEAILK